MRGRAPREPDNHRPRVVASVHVIGTQARGVKPENLLERLAAGRLRNVAFADLCRLAEALGFHLERVRGSHHVYAHQVLPVRLNLQDRHGEAKPYQIRQLLAVVEDYNLTLAQRGKRKQ